MKIKSMNVKKITSRIQILTLITVWLVFISPFIFGGKTPFPSNYQVNFFQPWNVYPGMGSPVKNNAQPDIITQIVPWRYFSVQEISSGRLPLWNPYSFAGNPHLANYQSAVLFPLNILFILPIEFIDSWSLLVLLQPLLAGIFTYILMRQYRVSKNGSLLSSLSFMFCGFIVVWLGYATLGYAILFLPLSLFSILKFESTRKLRWLIILSLTFPFSFFAGHFQTSLYFLLGVLSFTIYNFFTNAKKEIYLKTLLFVGIGLLLTMPQVLPSLELYTHSVRSELFQKVESIPLQYLVTLFSPDFFGNPVTRNDWFGRYAEWNGYTGIVALCFAIFAIMYKRNKATFYFIGLAFLALLLAIDSPLQQVLVALKIPVISTSAASRVIVLFSFAVAVLAGFGFDELFLSKKRGRRLVWVALVGIMFCFVTAIGFSAVNESDKISIAFKNSIFPTATLVATLGSCVAILVLKQRKIVTIVTVCLLLLAAFEMYRFVEKWQNFDPKARAYVDVPVEKFYSSQNRYDRAVGLAGGEDAVYFGIPILSGYDPLYKEEYGEFIQFVINGRILKPERSVVTFPYKGLYTREALDFLGVHHIVHKVSDGTFSWAFPFSDYPVSQFTKIYDDSLYQIFRNNNAFQRAFIVPEVEVLPHDKVPQRMFDSNLKTTAFIEEDALFEGRLGSGSASILIYNPGHIKIRTVSSDQSFLVLTDNFYPGWKAKVNGKSEKVYRTNYSFRGVKIPKGESIVEFQYFPMSFYAGVYLFLTGVMSIIVVVVIKSISSKK